jgi:hypothetical protein
MARAKPNRLSAEDRIALRMARLGGVALSAEEYDQLDDDLDLDDDGGDLNNPNGQQARLKRDGGGGGGDDTARWLRGLLRALGVEVAEQAGSELIQLAAKKVAELRGGGGKPKAAGNGNPLIPGSGGGDIAPMYPMSLSLAAIERIADPDTKRIALSLASECDRLNHDRREAAKAHQRQQESRLSEARSKRQAIVNRILAENPMVRREVEDLLNAADASNGGMAFGVDAQGNVNDQATTALMALERRVKDQLAMDRQPRSE